MLPEVEGKNLSSEDSNRVGSAMCPITQDEHWCLAWWCMPITPVLRSLCVQGQPGPHSAFNANLNYTARRCLKKQNKIKDSSGEEQERNFNQHCQLT